MSSVGSQIVVSRTCDDPILRKVWAGFDEGVAAYKRGDYATALRELRLLAELGVADAQSNLGVIFVSDGVDASFVDD